MQPDFATPGTWDAASASSIVVTDLTTLALAIRRARRHAKLSQRGLAARAGVAPSTVTRLERTIGDASIATVLRLVRAAGVRLEVTGLEPTTFPFGLVEDKRDNAERRAPPHRLNDFGYGYWDHTVSRAMRLAEESARGENVILAALGRLRRGSDDTPPA